MTGGSASDRKLASVFVGSSSERAELCRYVQVELQAAAACEVTTWQQGVFGPSSYSLDSLLNEARRADFALVVASADDQTSRRGQQVNVARDNVIFELGLFFGVLGRERTFVLNDRSSGDLVLPSDLAGLTELRYEARQDGNIRAAVGSAVLAVAERIKAMGPLSEPVALTRADDAHQSVALTMEIQRVCYDAVSQGWRVKTNSATTLRLVSPRGRRHTLSKEEAIVTRNELRTFVSHLRADGLRVNRSVRRPVAS